MPEIIFLGGLGVVFIILAVVYPKVLVYLIWPVLFLYPHRLTIGMLPFNIGFDDLFIVAVFLVIVVRFGVDQIDFSVKAALAFFLVLLLANLSWLLANYGPDQITRTLKVGLKGVVFVLATWSFSRTLDSEQDLKRHMYAFLVGVAGGCVTALLDSSSFPIGDWFWVPGHEREHYRATGAFLSPAGVGTNILLPAFIAGSLASRPGAFMSRVFMVSLCVLYTGTVLLAQSRSAWLGGVIGLFVMTFTVHRKVFAYITLAVVAAGFVLFFGDYYSDIVQDAIASVFTPGGISTHGRLEMWRSILDNPYLALLIFGYGQDAAISYLGGLPHSGYFDVFYTLGLGGTIYFFVVMWKTMRTSNWLRKQDPNPFFYMSSQGIWLGLIGTLGLAVTADPVYDSFWRYGFFFWIAWLWARQKQLEKNGYEIPYPTKGGVYSRQCFQFHSKPRVPILSFKEWYRAIKR